ncbi:MAG: hypothetical protein FWG68_04700 [Defluviitaleaceae bacterium]|nr:hypothetical protein [Defluviitaleaceae bacterium]
MSKIRKIANLTKYLPIICAVIFVSCAYSQEEPPQNRPTADIPQILQEEPPEDSPIFQNNNATTAILQPFTNTISAGWNHVLAITETGELQSWGGNSQGQLGLLENVAMVAAFADISAAIQQDGTLYIWGDSDTLQRFFGTIDGENLTKIAENAVHVAISEYFIVFVQNDGSLWGWADSNFTGFVESGFYPPFFLQDISVNADENAPTLLIAEGVRYVSVSYSHFMVVKTDNSLWGWGLNTDGYVGVGITPVGEDSYMYEPVFQPTFIMDNVAYVLAELEGTSAITLDGELWAWGIDYLVTGTRMHSGEPVFLLADILVVSSANNFGLTITDNRRLISWGWNWDISPSPTVDNPILLMENVAEIAVGGGFIIFRLENGEIWGFGNNQFGQLGQLGEDFSNFVPWDNPVLVGR